MDGLQEGAGIGEEGAAQQQNAQQQAAQAQQVAGGEKGQDGGATATDDSSGSARADFEVALAERDARIAELEGEIQIQSARAWRPPWRPCFESCRPVFPGVLGA